MKSEYHTISTLPQKTSRLISLKKVGQPNCVTKAKIVKKTVSFKRIDQVLSEYLDNIRRIQLIHQNTVFK